MANETGGTTSIYEILNGSGLVAGVTGWSLFIVNLPDTPDKCVVVLDSSPTMQGRYMVNGTRVERPGFQIMLRSSDYELGWAKIKAIAIHLDGILNEVLSDHTVGSIKRTSGPFYLGTEDTSNRYLFSLNGTISPES